jgi:SPP1 family predicted phage head-tail adaptor
MRDILNKLNKEIILENQVEIFDQDNGLEYRWQSVDKVFGYACAISDHKIVGNEVFQSMQLMYKNPYLFIIRYIDNIDTSYRILYRMRIFSIKRVININEQDAYLKIITEEEML